MVSAAAHRHQVSLGLSFKQVGLWFYLSLSLDLHHPTLGCADSQLRHPAFPLVHQLFPVRTLDTFYHDLYDILWCIFISAMQIVWWDEAPEIYKTSTTSSLHWCGAWLDIWGESSSSSWGKETAIQLSVFVDLPNWLPQKRALPEEKNYNNSLLILQHLSYFFRRIRRQKNPMRVGKTRGSARRRKTTVISHPCKFLKRSWLGELCITKSTSGIWGDRNPTRCSLMVI